jgi:hypothetical protein
MRAVNARFSKKHYSTALRSTGRFLVQKNEKLTVVKEF